MIKNRARGVPVDSCALMWMHHRRASGTLIKFDEGDYYGYFSRCAAKNITLAARTASNAGKDGSHD